MSSCLLVSGSLKRSTAVGITDNFNRANGALGNRSDGGTWTLVNGTAPVISSNTLVAGAAAGYIGADLGYQNGTYSVDVNTTVGTFTPIMRIMSDGSATTNYLGIAIDTIGANPFGISVFTIVDGTFSNVGMAFSTNSVFTSGVTGTISAVITGAPSAPSITVKFNGTTIPSNASYPNAVSQYVSVAGKTGATKTGPEMAASGVTLDNFSAV